MELRQTQTYNGFCNQLQPASANKPLAGINRTWGTNVADVKDNANRPDSWQRPFKVCGCSMYCIWERMRPKVSPGGH